MKEELVNTIINYLVNEYDYKINIPSNYDEKRLLLKKLVNVREPKFIDEEILTLEDKLLKLELKEKNIINALDLDEIEKNISLYKGDITCISADLIVNAGNEYGLGCFIPLHSCIDNAIHSNAGMRLRLECNEKLNGKTINNGEILVCNGYNLPSKKVITTVGPQIYGDVRKQDEIDLSNCYKNSLEYAVKHNFKTIVFPSISTGVFAYPISKAKIIAYNTVKEFLKDNDIKVIFNLFSDEDYNEYEELFRNKE